MSTSQSNTKRSAPASINWPNIAFVSPSSGNNATGTVGDLSKPYQTITAASSASDIIYMLPDVYTETFLLGSGKTYFASPGVLFTAGGVDMTSGVLNGTKFLGYATFNSNSRQMYLDNVTLTNVEIEFDSMTTTGSLGRTIYIDCDAPSSVQIRGNKVYDQFCGNAHGVLIKGPVTGSIDITDSNSGAYAPLTLGFQPESGATGELLDFTINCPRTIVLDGGIAGNNASFKQGIHVLGIEANSTVTLNGDIHHDTSVALAAPSSGVRALYTSTGNFIHNGNIYSNLQRSVINQSDMTMFFNGNIDSGSNIFNCSNGITVFKNMTSSQSIANSLTGTAEVYVYDSTFNSDSADDVIDYLTGTGKLLLSNVGSQSDASSLFINTNSNTYSSLMTNTNSNVANDASLVDTLSGFNSNASFETL